ncbi:sigma-70 family RNA polymerase sigma factor [Rhizobium sp. 18065]|uniref:RNA polymerase sigma factor n=1 Tax=Rhizobium sp. 18065 TaxID=2681411 RepID=UPI001FCE6AD2|nr:sigma-70 family RNA polymerase sigma factor [Rhizobium sp. 18065]
MLLEPIMVTVKKDARYEMYLKARKALVDYATPITGSRDDAEDIVQDAFLKFVPDASEGPPPPKAYLFRIVRNLSFNKRRRRKLETKDEPDDIPWWAWPQSHPSPEADLVLQQQVKLVARAIERLPDRERAVMEMYRFEKMTLQEIAERLAVSVATAHRLLSTAMRRLRDETRDIL